MNLVKDGLRIENNNCLLRHNRSVYAPLPSVAPGFRSPRSVATLLPTAHSTHIFASPGNLRFPLSGLQKRHIQPER
jgi:hypothetical protein